jgi:protein gp37
VGEITKIGWTDHTMNPWIGCARVSAECDHCYADTGSRRLAAKYKLTLWDEGSRRFLTSDDYWKQPLRWNRKAEAEGRRARVFCASFSDVFEDRPELQAPRERLRLVIERTPSLDWLLLTKRPENMVRMMGAWRSAWPSNVWAGTTAGLTSSLEERHAELARVPARIRFLSMEPLLEEVSLEAHWSDSPGDSCVWLGFDWVIVGSESGAKARPMEPAWAARIVKQCKAWRVPVFVKQMATATGHAMGDHHGIDPRWWPAGEWPREWPT